MFRLFGFIAVALACVGVYGSTAFSVRDRTSEIGVRMALGARASDVARGVLGRALVIMSGGWILGSMITLATVPLIDALLFGVAPLDAISFMKASFAIVVAMVAGASIPTLEAARVDPAASLRRE